MIARQRLLAGAMAVALAACTGAATPAPTATPAATPGSTAAGSAAPSAAPDGTLPKPEVSSLTIGGSVQEPSQFAAKLAQMMGYFDNYGLKVDFIATRGHDRGVYWFEAPDWKEHVIQPTLKEPHCLVVADFNRDGKLDCATCGYGDKLAFWFENDGKGNFKPPTTEQITGLSAQ